MLFPPCLCFLGRLSSKSILMLNLSNPEFNFAFCLFLNQRFVIKTTITSNSGLFHEYFNKSRKQMDVWRFTIFLSKCFLKMAFRYGLRSLSPILLLPLLLYYYLLRVTYRLLLVAYTKVGCVDVQTATVKFL